MSETVTYRGPAKDGELVEGSIVRSFRHRESGTLLRRDVPTEVEPAVADALRSVEGHKFDFGKAGGPEPDEASKASDPQTGSQIPAGEHEAATVAAKGAEERKGRRS